MKKLVTLAAGVLLIGMTTWGANSIAPTFTGTIVIANAYGTNTTSEFWIGNADAAILGTREIESFSVYNASGTNAAIGYLIMTDGGFDTTIGTSASVVAGVGSIVYPVRTLTDATIAGWVVTGNVAVATSTVVSKYVPYNVRKAKVRMIQSLTLGPGSYDFVIKAK